MNGPDHYREAERFLNAQQEMVAEFKAKLTALSTDQLGPVIAFIEATGASAHVHATLALAAAQIDAVLGEIEPGEITGTSPWITAVHG